MLIRTGIRAGRAAAAAILCAATPATAARRLTVYPLAGFGHARHDGTPAANFAFSYADDVRAAPDGSFAVLENERLVRFGPDGLGHFVPGRFGGENLAAAPDGSV